MITNGQFLFVTVSDLERSIKFYTETFGMKLERTQDSKNSRETSDLIGFPPDGRILVAWLRLGNLALGLQSFPNRPGRSKIERNDVGCTRVVFTSNDVEGDYRRLKEKGVRFISEPIKFPRDLVIVFGYDPDGLVFSLRSREGG